jgi:AP-3 complex subunit beta
MRRDSLQVRKIKLKILALISNKENINIIMSRFAKYASTSEHEFASFAVKMMGRIASSKLDTIDTVFNVLIKLIGRTEGKVLNEVVFNISCLLRLRGTEDQSEALKQLCKKFVIVKDHEARAAIISIVGDMYEAHQAYAPQLLQYVARDIENESAEVKLQSLTLSAKLIACGYEKKEVPMYVLQICQQDEEFDIRDRARFLLCLIENKNEEIKRNLKQLLFTQREQPTRSIADLCSEFQIGTFSHFFNRAIQGYERLPDWAPEDQLPAASSRNNGFIDAPTENGAANEAESSNEEELSDFFGAIKEKEEELLKSDQKVTKKQEEKESYYSYSYYSDEE